VSFQHRDPAIAEAERAIIRVHEVRQRRCATIRNKLTSGRRRARRPNAIRTAQHIEDLGRKYGTQDLRIYYDAVWRERSNTETLLQQAKMNMAAVDSLTAPRRRT
jgi:hypothetical protein